MREVKLKKAFNMAICACLLIGAVLILGCSIFTTIYYKMHQENDKLYFKAENIPLLVISVGLSLFVFYIFKKKEIFTKNKKLMAIGLLFCILYCLILIFSIKPMPVNDSGLLDAHINSFVRGDYSQLTEKGGYLYTWPFQLGYVFFGEFMTKVFGSGNYLAWNFAQLISILFTMYFLDKICMECFEDAEICGIMSFLSMGALFFYNYVTYIYGDILSMGPQTLALYLMIRYMKTGEQRYGLGSGLSISIGVMLKTNCEIAVIALIMILFINGIGSKSDDAKVELKNRVIIALCMLVFVFGQKAYINNHYMKVTGLEEIPKGNPSVAHIAMGLQEDGGLEPGWYNGYNYRVFGDNNYDTELTKKAAVAKIGERFELFAHHPFYAARFFTRKYITQWADPVCISTQNLDYVSRHHEISALGNSIVFGVGSTVLAWIMNVFMTLCYLGVVVYLAGVLRKRHVSDYEMLMLLLIFGGMVFHEFWEGSSRYAMRYYIYQLPFAACGLKVLLGLIHEHKLKKI
jgi:hypothetical protein